MIGRRRRCEFVGPVGACKYEYFVSQRWNVIDVKVAVTVKAPGIGYAATGTGSNNFPSADQLSGRKSERVAGEV